MIKDFFTVDKNDYTRECHYFFALIEKYIKILSSLAGIVFVLMCFIRADYTSTILSDISWETSITLLFLLLTFSLFFMYYLGDKISKKITVLAKISDSKPTLDKKACCEIGISLVGTTSLGYYLFQFNDINIFLFVSVGIVIVTMFSVIVFGASLFFAVLSRVLLFHYLKFKRRYCKIIQKVRHE